MRIWLAVIFCISWLTSITFADTGWRKYGWQVYNNMGDARSIALGNAISADNKSISIYSNPGNIGLLEENKLTYGHQSRFAGIIQSDLIVYPFKTKKLRPFNILLIHESVSKIPNTQNLLLDWGLDGVPNTGDVGEDNGYLDDGERLNSEDATYFNQHQIGAHVTSQFEIYGVEFGIAVKTLFHSLGKHFGTGIGMDIGMSKSFWNNSNLGIAIHNLIPSMVVWDSGNTEISKPQLFAGISQSIKVPDFPVSLILLSDIIIDFTNQSLSDDFTIGSTGGNWRLGVELNYNKIGLRFGRNQFGYYSTGVGLLWTNLELNYAYQFNPNSINIGANHVLSFSLNPNWVLKKINKEKQ